MSKNVIVIASGETERRSLPRLLAHLKTEDVIVDDVRIPPRKNNALSVEMAEKLIRSAWFGNSCPPAKFVVLLDADGKVADDVLRPFRDELPKRIGGKIPAALQFAVAQWHLESWQFRRRERLERLSWPRIGQCGHLETRRNPESKAALETTAWRSHVHCGRFGRNRQRTQCAGDRRF